MAYRLDAFLSHRGFGSRTQVRGLIRRGRVTLAGEICRDQGEHVAEREVRVDGAVVVVGVVSATLLLHKPMAMRAVTMSARHRCWRS